MAESHIFFFSYAHGDENRDLEDFFTDLCNDVADPTEFQPDDSEVSFRDRKSLSVMDNWKTHIESALQSSAVLVCVTSKKYLNSEFSGKEYYVFDQRRRQGLNPGSAPPENVLPIVWNPVDEGLPDFFGDVQQTFKGMPSTIVKEYLENGLRHLKRFNRAVYDQCVNAFARAIRAAWKTHGKIKQLPNVAEFPDIPNAFAGGHWQEAADRDGWKRGPEVANFIFAAETKDEVSEPQYGALPAEWAPYLPPEITTVVDYVQKAMKKQFLFREIRTNVADELKFSKGRLNLSLVIGSPKALLLENFKDVRTIESVWWDGTALLVPCSDGTVDDQSLRQLLQPAFPKLSIAKEPNFVGPIHSADALVTALDATLSRMRSAVKGPEIEKKPVSDNVPPPSVSGSPSTTGPTGTA